MFLKMDSPVKKSLNYPSYSDTKYENFTKPILSTSTHKTNKVLSTSSKKTPTKNKEDEIDEINKIDEISENNLEDLFDKLYLDEFVTIKNDDGKESIDDGKERVFYNFFEIGHGCDPKEIKKLSPWTDNGPILKTLPTFNEMEYFIKKQKCTCLLLNCEKSVVTKNIDIYSFEITPWNFLCSYHKKKVRKKYGYEIHKNI
jgi:hypothetical protein